MAYLDDIYIICSRDTARSSFSIVKDCLHRLCSIDVNLGKLAAWSRNSDEAPEGIAELNTQDEDPVWKADLPALKRGVKVVGTPIGSLQFIRACCDKVIAKEEKLFQILPKLFSLQAT